MPTDACAESPPLVSADGKTVTCTTDHQGATPGVGLGAGLTPARYTAAASPVRTGTCDQHPAGPTSASCVAARGPAAGDTLIGVGHRAARVRLPSQARTARGALHRLGNTDGSEVTVGSARHAPGRREFGVYRDGKFMPLRLAPAPRRCPHGASPVAATRPATGRRRYAIEYVAW